MHIWGDKDFDWVALDSAIMLMVKEMRRFRIPIRDYKEKWGTARIYCSLGWNCLLDITHPGFCHYRPYPKWLMRLDIYYISKIVRKMNFIVLPIHKWAYRRAYRMACEKYPHIKQEICCVADFPDLLTGLF